MSQDLYLILHKVRGEPAFDIAINIGNEEDGDMWIIPTSGHRAYPSDWFVLSWALDADGNRIIDHMEQPDSTTPDHYSANATPRPNLRELFARLLSPTPTAIKKRQI